MEPAYNSTLEDLHSTYERSRAMLEQLELLLAQRTSGSSDSAAPGALARLDSEPTEPEQEPAGGAHEEGEESAVERSSGRASAGSGPLRRAGSLPRRPALQTSGSANFSRTAIVLPQVSVRESSSGGAPDVPPPGIPISAAAAAAAAGSSSSSGSRLPRLLELSPLTLDPATATRRGALPGSPPPSLLHSGSIRASTTGGGVSGSPLSGPAPGCWPGQGADDGYFHPGQQQQQQQQQQSAQSPGGKGGGGQGWGITKVLRRLRPSQSFNRMREGEGGAASPLPEGPNSPGAAPPTPQPPDAVTALLQQHCSSRARRNSSIMDGPSTTGGGLGGDGAGSFNSRMHAIASMQLQPPQSPSWAGGGPPSSSPSGSFAGTTGPWAASPSGSGSFRGRLEPSNLSASSSASAPLHATLMLGGGSPAGAAGGPGALRPSRAPADRRMSMPSGAAAAAAAVASAAARVVGRTFDRAADAKAEAAVAAAAAAYMCGGGNGSGSGSGSSSFRRTRLLSEAGPLLVVPSPPQRLS